MKDVSVFRIPLSTWVPQEERKIKRAFLPFLRTLFYDRTPQYIECTREEQTNKRGFSATTLHQKVHYFMKPDEVPVELATRYLSSLLHEKTVVLEVVFCGSEPNSSLSQGTPYAELIFHQKEFDVPKRQFNPMDYATSEQNEFSLARPDENDSVGNDLIKIKDDIDPDLGIVDMNKFFANRLQWIREALISCEHAVEIMLEGIKISLGMQKGKEPPEHWEAMGHTLYTCDELKCLEFRSDWHTIIHMDKYLPWEDLYNSYKETFHKWGIRKIV